MSGFQMISSNLVSGAAFSSISLRPFAGGDLIEFIVRISNRFIDCVIDPAYTDNAIELV